MMTFDHDEFLPPFVKLSTSPCCTYFSSQYDGTHYYDNTQHGARYNSTERTTLPLPGESQRTYLSTVNVHNDRLIDSAHFAQPMSHDSTYTSPSIAHVCSDRPADSTRIVSYIRRQYARTVPNVDIVGSSKCHTRHLATGGVARFNYVLVTNSNPVTTCASDGRVNPYPNMVARLETPSLANSKWDYSPCLNCSNPSFSLQGLTNTNTTAAYCVENKILSPNAHFFLQTQLTQPSHPFLHSQSFTMSPPALTRSPNPKANPPTTPCVKPTKQMATYVATPDDFDAPFDALLPAPTVPSPFRLPRSTSVSCGRS